jgi:NAD(P)-dependent dehydrogenase (short-subunit alcohol dehydrogenase family)
MSNQDAVFLQGQNALVTGGTRGIGLAIAKSLAAAGCNVSICGRTQGAVDQAVSAIGASANGGSKVVGIPADISNPEDVLKFFEFTDDHIGKADIVVNNAGIGIFKKTSELTIEDWRKTIGLNLDGVFYVTHAALERFRERGGGYLMQISSLAGKNPFAGGAAYNASKFGLNGFSEAVMLDHRHDNVRVTSIMPGSVATEFSPGGSTAGADWKIAPEDIADIVMSLLRLPARTLVSRVEVRPSKPGKG